MTHAPTITVVVCTRNRADRLPAALGSLARLDDLGRFTYEVLVVDNGSTDGTPELVDRMAEAFPVPLRRVREDRPGVAVARNRGVAEAAGEWVAFFDDDQAAAPAWLAELLALAERKRCRCVGGMVRLKLPEGVHRKLSPVCEMLLGCSVNMDAERRYTPGCTPGAGNLMVRRDVFDEIGTFDATMSRGEDTDLFLRMYVAGIEAWYSPAAIIDHLIPADRLSDEFLLRVAERMSEGSAASERFARGPAVYPAVWLARVAQAAGVLWPRWLLATVRGDREAALGAKCRLRIASGNLREGAGLLWPGRNTPDSCRPASGGSQPPGLPERRSTTHGADAPRSPSPTTV